jgi:predicted RNase H-like nuclease (RuvC/YqgF family)
MQSLRLGSTGQRRSIRANGYGSGMPLTSATSTALNARRRKPALVVRHDAVNAMLLNEFLKEHSTVQELKKEIATLTATVKEQASLIQKVSAQLEVSKPEPRTVLNSQ